LPWAERVTENDTVAVAKERRGRKGAVGVRVGRRGKYPVIGADLRTHIRVLYCVRSTTSWRGTTDIVPHSIRKGHELQ
jgi:hypothetical protein